MINPKAIISALLIRKNKENELELFLQTRWKPAISPTYSGMLEIPAGAIDSYENVYNSLKREIKEETNLEIVKIIDDYQGQIRTPRQNDSSFVFKPFICQQATETNNGLPWVGFVFLCEVKGEVILNTSEAKDPKWVTESELRKIVTEDFQNIFPLQLPVLEYFLENIKKINL